VLIYGRLKPMFRPPPCCNHVSHPQTSLRSQRRALTTSWK